MQQAIDYPCPCHDPDLIRLLHIPPPHPRPLPSDACSRSPFQNLLTDYAAEGSRSMQQQQPRA